MKKSNESNGQASEISRFFEEAFQERVNRSPQTLTALGIRKHQDQLDDLSDAKLVGDRDLFQDQLARLEQFDFASLSPSDQLSYRIFQLEATEMLRRLKYRFHDYLITQMSGLHVDFPAFMINMHGIARLEDARHYITRLHAFDRSCEQVIARLDQQQSLGVIPPAFLFPQIIADCTNFIGDQGSGTSPEHNILYKDFADKLAKLNEVDPKEKDGLLHGLKQALGDSVIPAYRKLIMTLEKAADTAPPEGGAWSLPDGEGFYQACLERHTSTALTADDIHRLGIEDVARIQQEMLELKNRLGVHGNLQAIFSFARDNPDFYFTQTEEGKQQYLDGINRIVATIKPRLPELFTVFPEDDLLVKPVEVHREKTAGIAFYRGPAADGSRPGIFYVNLYDLRQLSTFTMEALAYHEALPGHHMQFSIANRLKDLPTFRRYADYNAYIEGWGLYSELIARGIGLYQDPWADFGRLAQELKRACRLVVDTGLHARRWTRQQAIDYLYAKIPSSMEQVIKEVDRYIVMPGQATSYKVGMSALLKLRSEARAALGAKFDMREFHDELLRNGPLPLPLLGEQIAAWRRARQ